MPQSFSYAIKSFTPAPGKVGDFYSLPALAQRFPNVNRLPLSLRIVLESVLRHCDGKKVTAEHVAQLANWQPRAERSDEIPFVVSDWSGGYSRHVAGHQGWFKHYRASI